MMWCEVVRVRDVNVPEGRWSFVDSMEYDKVELFPKFRLLESIGLIKL